MNKNKARSSAYNEPTVNTQKPVKRYRKGVVALVNTLLALVLVVCLLGTGACAALLYWDFSDSGNVEADLSDVVKSESEDVVYFLVAGMDEGETLTDIMMVVCYDIKAGKASILQIPRDTFIGVDVPTGKMNAVYGRAPREEGQTNINAMLRRINDSFGLPVDHYITVTLSAFRDIVDAVGGVDVYVPSTIRNAWDQQRNHYTFNEGMNHMNGSMAEAFVRHRKSYAMGDLGRVKAQRSFYAAFIQKCLDMNYGQMAAAATSIYDKVSTDMKLVDILAYAKHAQKLGAKNVEFYALPGQGGMFRLQNWGTLSYYSIHKQEYADLLNEYFMPYAKTPVTAESLRIDELHTTYFENYIEDAPISEYLPGTEDDDATESTESEE